MKTCYYLSFVAAVATMTSCYHSAHTDGDVIETDTSVSKAFTFHVKGDFAAIQEDMTRASVRLENDNSAALTDLWVLDYNEDGDLLQEKHQSSTDSDFGHPSLNLTYGHHDVKFIVSKGGKPSKAGTGITWSKVNDTYCLDYPVDVAASSNGNRAPELKRCIAGVTIENTDAIPANAKQMEVTIINRYSTLTLPGLTGSNPVSYTNTFTYLATDAGTTGLRLNTYTLCPDETFSVNVQVRVIGNDNSVISEFAVNDVALKVNRKTVLKGECFDRSNGFSVSINDAWDEADVIMF